MQRTTGKLLATQGYVVGIEISGSGSRQSVALADLNGTILHRVRRPLEYVPDTETVLHLLDDMLAEVMHPEQLHDGRILRVGVAIGGLVNAARGIVRTLHHAHGWDDFPLQDYFEQRLDVPCIIDNNANAAALAEVIGDAMHKGRDVGDLGVLRRYERWRKGDNLAMIFALDAFKRLFSNENAGISTLRNAGLRAVDRFTPLKHAFVRRAMGLSGDLPALAR
jgi:hypothetical protein